MGLPDEVASTRINRYERGVHLPDMPTAKALAEALGVPISALVEDQEDIAIVAACMGQLGKRDRARLVKAVQKALGKERTQEVLAQLGLAGD